MIPPHVRTGPVPPVQKLNDQTRYVVLTRAGWHIVTWHPSGNLLLDEDAVAINTRFIYPHDVLCWMPADGS